MKIVLIGAGNVATHLGIALQKAGCLILQVYSRTEESASALAARLSVDYTLGTLEKGKKADIVVFDGNLFETAIEEIRSRKVEVTFLNGRIVYSHE